MKHILSYAIGLRRIVIDKMIRILMMIQKTTDQLEILLIMESNG